MNVSIKRWLLMSFMLFATSAFGRLYLVEINDCSHGFWPTQLTIVTGDSVMFSNADPEVVNNGVCADGVTVPTAGPHNVLADDNSFRCAMGCDGEGGNGAPSAAFWYFAMTFDAPGMVSYHDQVTGAAGVINVLAPSSLAVAVEYYDPNWDFYFVTASPDEIAALDGGAFGGVWKRTGQSFNVWTDASTGAVPTCRFLGTAFAPKSTHFYTAETAECAELKASPDWQYEEIAFNIQLPDANGGCSADTVPLYRLYNNSMEGAPNHRYTTSEALRDQMQAAGWVAEGNVDTSAYACVVRSSQPDPGETIVDLPDPAVSPIHYKGKGH